MAEGAALKRATFGRALVSAAALLVVVVVVPIALVAAARSRFGGSSPLSGTAAPWDWGRDRVSRALGDRLTDATVVDLIVRTALCAVWLCVAVVVATTVVEIVHVLRHGGLSMPDVRGLGWAQGIARFIAAGLLVVGPHLQPASAHGASLSARAGALAAPTPIEQVWDGLPTAADPPTRSTADDSRVSGVAHVVQRNESVWSIAAALSGGDDRRTAEIADRILDANLGREMGGGQQFTNPAIIHTGWVLELPPDVVRASTTAATTGNAGAPEVAAPDRTVVVERGDTLSGIAEAALGDAASWPEIWEANAHREMGDGRTFDDPNLILPGWEIEVPGSSATPTTQPVAEPTPSAPSPTPPVTPVPTVPATSTPPTTVAGSSTPTSTVPPSTAASPTNRAVPSTTGVTAESTTTSSSSTTTSAVAPAAPDRASTRTDLPAATGTPSPIRLDHAALFAAGVLGLVGVHRRRRLRAARAGVRIPEPSPRAIATERELRTLDAGDIAIRIDVALRAAAHTLVDAGVGIAALLVGADGAIEVELTGPALLPPPWAPVEDREAVAGHTQDDRTWVLPASVPIDTLADDARRAHPPCVALALLGVADDGRDVFVDLEAVGVLTVHADGELADDVVRAIAAGLAVSEGAEIAHLIACSLGAEALLGHRNAHHVDSADAALDLAGTLVGSTMRAERTTFALRALGTGGELWEPAVVLLTTTDTADAADPTRFGAPTSSEAGGDGLAIVAACPQPPEVGTSPGRSARLVADRPSWRLEIGGRTIAMTPVGITRSDLRAVTDLVEEATAPLVWADDEGVQVDQAAGGADEDRGPFVERDHAIVVRLLGSVTVASSDGTEAHFERSKTVELIAWLATHRDRATRTGARTALWDLDVRDATFANVVSEARRGLARLVEPADGEEWIPRTLNESLPLHDLVVTDADLARDRLRHARSQAPERAIETLRPAVELIRDVPFAGSSYLWPDAEGTTSELVLLATGAAAELATHALTVGDTELVFWATGQGLRVLPGHEELIALRMRAHARAGDLAGVRQEWETYERVVVADPWSDGEPAPKLRDLRRELLGTPA